MAEQNAFGSRKVHRQFDYGGVTKIARVTSTADFHAYARIEVIFLDYGQPMPVWIVNDLDREPVEGDKVVIGYIDGRKDAPYLIGFVKNESYTTNFVVVKKDKIKLQLPVFEVGVKDGVAHKDVQGNLLDNAKQAERAYVELTPDYALVSFPTDKDGATPPAVIRITATEATVSHPVKVVMDSPEFTFGSGAKQVACLGDTVAVTVTGSDPQGGTITSTGTGTITSASTKFKIE